MTSNRRADMTLPIQVKTYDIDVAGIVHNSVYLCWMDDLRCELLTRVQPLEHQLEAGYIPVLARTVINYKRPIKFGDKVIAHLWLSEVSRIRWKVRAEFKIGDVTVTEIAQEGCMVDLKTHKPIEIPEALKKFWLKVKQSGDDKTFVVDETTADDLVFEQLVCPV